MRASSQAGPAPQRGISLIEALIGLLVLSLGLLGMTHMQSTLRSHADLSRQRIEAVRLAQHEIERLRGFASSTAYADIASLQATNTLRPTAFTLRSSVDDGRTGTIKTATVDLQWTDRSGTSQAVALGTSLAGTLPVYSGILGLPTQDKAVSKPFGRALRIPINARNIADGRSVLRPSSRSGVALVFNQGTGRLSSLCTGLAAAPARADLLASELQQCEAVTGSVVTGYIRFSLAALPNAARANDAPLQLNLALVLDRRADTGCDSEAMKTVSFNRNGQTHTETVPASATPASLGATPWTEHGERFVAYACWVVTPSAGTGWSGHLAVTPDGWLLGTTPGAYKVCRYSSDTDGSGAIDRNEEHPARYTDVHDALAQQNYLIVRGDADCPSGGVGATFQQQP